MAKENWRDITIDSSFLETNVTLTHKKVNARAYYRTAQLQEVDARRYQVGSEVYMADFVYLNGAQGIVKNRLGSIEKLFECAIKYDRLRLPSAFCLTHLAISELLQPSLTKVGKRYVPRTVKAVCRGQPVAGFDEALR